jgi:hypothetical protein
MKRIQALIVFVAFALLSSSAFAHPQTLLDPDDVSGSLDIVAARQAHDAESDTFNYRIVTYEPWDDLGGMTYLSIEFASRKGMGPDRCLDVGRDGSLEGVFYKSSFAGCVLRDDEHRIGSVDATRSDDHSLELSIPASWVARKGDTFKWRAVTSYEKADGDCAPPDPVPPERRYGACMDISRWKVHRSS